MEGQINSFNDLEAWKLGHEFVQLVYKETENFPYTEKYGLISKMRRASVSITANIAEGFALYYFKDKIRFYYNSRGSVAEVQNFLYLTRDLSYIDKEKVDQLLEQSISVYKLVNGLIRSTENQLK